MNYKIIGNKDVLLAILKNAVDGIIIISNRGIIQLINPAAATLFDYTENELLGQNIKILMGLPHQEKHDSYLERYEHTKTPRIIGIGREVEGRRKDGSSFPFKLSVSEVQFEGERIYVGNIHDITEQKTVEESIRKINIQLEQKIEKGAEKLAEVVNQLLSTNKALKESELEVKRNLVRERELNEMKSRFVSMASHEFRTPLSTILSSASLLARYTTTAQQAKRQKHIERIKSAVSNLTTILNDFLSISKLEEGKLTVQLTYFDLEELVKEVIEEIHVFAKAGQEIYLSSMLTDHRVYLDRNLTKNILINLLSNAVKYSNEQQKIDINLALENTNIQINVQDYGIGIPTEDQVYLFDRFFRAKNVTHIQGTGLGLNIVRKYTELLGGQIYFQSTFMKGSTFTVLLPFQKK